jgi:hypothetical protein
MYQRPDSEHHVEPGEGTMKSAVLNAPERDATKRSERKLNCWEYKRCGRQPQGTHVKELGLCPASVEWSLDDVHEGTNAGRSCWTVSGTLCKGQVQGTFAQKYKNCEICDFYQLVRKEEGPNFVYSSVLLSRMKKK